MGAVYFQPTGYGAVHGLEGCWTLPSTLEADIHANQKGTELGGKGDFVPDLTVNYTIIDKSTGKEVEGGTATSRYLHADERFRWPALRR